jgi:hypothetical protein
VAAGNAPKVLLTEKAASSLIRRIRKGNWQASLASDYLSAHAPEHHLADYLKLWAAFVAESQASLLSDRDPKIHEALALLRRECNLS